MFYFTSNHGIRESIMSCGRCHPPTTAKTKDFLRQHYRKIASLVTRQIKLNKTYMLTLSTLVILNTISETPPTGMRSLPVVKSRTCFCRSVDISVTMLQKFLPHNRRHRHSVLAAFFLKFACLENDETHFCMSVKN